jgi:hypothetical protein
MCGVFGIITGDERRKGTSLHFRPSFLLMFRQYSEGSDMRLVAVVVLACLAGGCSTQHKSYLIDSWDVSRNYRAVYDRIRRQIPTTDLEPQAVGGGLAPAYTPFAGGTLGIAASPPSYVNIIRWDQWDDVNEAKIWLSGVFEVTIKSTGDTQSKVTLRCSQPLDNGHDKEGFLNAYNREPAFRVDWIEESLGEWNPKSPRQLVQAWRQEEERLHMQGDSDRAWLRERGL